MNVSRLGNIYLVLMIVECRTAHVGSKNSLGINNLCSMVFSRCMQIYESVTDANAIDGRKSSPSFCNTCSLLLTRFRRHMSGLIAADCQWNPQFVDFLVRERCITGSESCMWDAIHIHIMWLKTNPIQGPI